MEFSNRCLVQEELRNPKVFAMLYEQKLMYINQEWLQNGQISLQKIMNQDTMINVILVVPVQFWEMTFLTNT